MRLRRSQLFTVAVMAYAFAASPMLLAESGKSIYDRKCAKCHGDNGDGKGRAGRGLEHKSTPFNDKTKMAGIADEHMFKAIKGGGEAVQQSKEMEAYPTLSDSEIKDVIAYIRTLAK